MKASIIILTYNELETGTKPCIESIYKYTDPHEFEIVIVDNNSKDGTPSYLTELEKTYSNIKIQLNKENRGFPGGVNDGIKLSEGEFVILLNNDTLVTPNWLDNLLYPFTKDKDIGLTGPLTNNSSSEQVICIKNINEKNYIDLTSSYIEKRKTKFFLADRITFFCTAIKREIIDKIGLLDENFGIGMLEDDDYCQRAVNAGFKIAISEGCFIFHQGSLSFGKTMLFHWDDNINYYNSKHANKWVLSSTIINCWKKIKADFIEYEKTNSELSLENIHLRLEYFDLYLNVIKNYEIQSRKHMKIQAMIVKAKKLISYPERLIRSKFKK